MKTAEQLKALCDELNFDGLGPRPDYAPVDNIKCSSFIRDGVLKVSGEDGRGLIDYYGEYRGGYPYINPKLEAFAKEHGMHWEWDDPGSISLWEGV